MINQSVGLRRIHLQLMLLLCPMVNFPQSDTLLRAPIVGIPMNEAVPVLIKGIDSGQVRMHYRPADQQDVRDSTAWHDLVDDHDFTTAISLPTQDPQSVYEYQVEFEGGSATPWYSFRTFPESGASGKFDFVFSACFREKYQPHIIYDHIKDMAPVFVALLGDNMYADYNGDVNASGIYLLRIEAGEFRQTRKTILLKSLSGRAAAMT